MDRRGFLLAAAAATATRSSAAPAYKTPQMFGAVPDGVSDNTAALQKMLDSGGDIRWTPGRYLTGRLALRSRTRIVFDPGAFVTGMPGQPGVFRADNAEDLLLEGKGATIYGPPRIISHTVNLAGARRATLRGLKIGGGGAGGGGKDALYIGRGSAPCQDIHIDGCALHDARRNCLSVIECFGYVIENCDIHGAKGAPGAGIDVEANRHGTLGGGVIRRNRVHGNQRFGILVAFGDDVRIHRNEVFGNGAAGIAVGAGAAQWNEGVYRPGIDMVAVSGFNPATGEVGVSDVSNIEVGTIVSWRSRKGSGPPPEFADGRYMVLARNAARRTLILSADGAAPITRVTQTGRVRLSPYMEATDLALRVQAEGQASNVDIFANRCHGNGGQREIDVSTSVRVRVRDNDIDAGLDRAGIFAAYARRLSITGNRIRGSGASTSLNSRGLHIGMSSHVDHGGNIIDGFADAGVHVNGVGGTYKDRGDTITNCGWRPDGAPRRVLRVPG